MSNTDPTKKTGMNSCARHFLYRMKGCDFFWIKYDKLCKPLARHQLGDLTEEKKPSNSYKPIVEKLIHKTDDSVTVYKEKFYRAK